MDEVMNEGGPVSDETVDTSGTPNEDGFVPMAETVEEPTPAAKRKFKLKVDGQEFEEEYDDTDLVDQLQRAKMADRRAQEAADEKKQVQQLINLIKTDPVSVMQKTGMSHEEIIGWADRVLGSHLENMSMSPEERQRRIDNEELNRFREEQRRIREEQEASQVTQQKQEIRAQIENQLVDAMQKHNLPSDPQTRAVVIQDAIRMLAADKVYALKNGRQPSLNPERAMAKAVAQRDKDQLSLLSRFTDDELYDKLGADVIKRIRKVDTARYSSKKIPSNRQSQNTAPVKPKTPEKRVLNDQDFESYLNGFKKK